MNIVFTPHGWEDRIRSGGFSIDLLRPIHPLNSDVAFIAGMKVVVKGNERLRDGQPVTIFATK